MASPVIDVTPDKLAFTDLSCSTHSRPVEEIDTMQPTLVYEVSRKDVDAGRSHESHRHENSQTSSCTRLSSRRALAVPAGAQQASHAHWTPLARPMTRFSRPAPSARKPT